ncbi:MAG TPA: DUF5906 domain-containing protein [Phycisphaerales bacterium]|nr:DUF5906 domain-containing protein [Phycisphaerales bacterium]
MAGGKDGWVSCTKGRPCPICEGMERKGKNSYCRYHPRLDATGTEAFICMKSSGGFDQVNGWKVMEKWVKGTKPPVYEKCLTRNKEGATYIPSEAEIKPLTEKEIAAESERRRRAEAIEKAEREKSIGWARELWNEAGKELVLGRGPAHLDGSGPGHPRIAEYFEARGVAIADLPGQRLPSHVRFYGQTYGTHQKNGKKVRFTGPAILFACFNREKKIQCVQRIWLDYGGKPVKASPPSGVPADEWNPKMSLGSTSGIVWWLNNPARFGTLVLAEGPETSGACLAATHVGVGCVLSTTGLKTLDLPAELTEPGSGLRTVIFAADCDGRKANGTRPGQDAAGDAAKLLAEKYPHLVVRKATPSQIHAPALFDATGEPLDGGCDWLDVYNAAGKDVVRTALLETSIVVSSGKVERAAGEADELGPDDGDPGDGANEDRELAGGDGPVIRSGEVPQARTLLKNIRVFSPPADGRAGECFRVAHWRGLFYRYVNGGPKGPRWKEISHDSMRGLVWTRLQRYRILKRKHYVRMDPSRKTAENVRDAMIAEISVDSNDGSVLLPAKFDADGKPLWSDRHPEQECVEAQHLIPVLNGILDINLLKKRVVRLMPHTPRLFSQSCRPFAVDVKLLEEVLAAGQEGQDELGRKHWPVYQGMLDHYSLGNALWKERMWRWFGLCLTPIVKHQKAAFFLGPPGRGKSTVLWLLREVVGPESVAAATFALIGDRFGRASLVGKNVVTIGDAGSSRHGDPGAQLEMVKAIIGGDVVPVERKQQDVYELRLTCKLTVASNDLQKLPDTAGAMPRRILPFRFDAPLDEKDMDRDREEKLRAELPAIFCAALAALVRLELAPRDKAFELGDIEREEIAKIKLDNEPLFGFVEDHLVSGLNPRTGELYKVTGDDLYKAYEAWAESEHVEHRHTRPVLMKKLGAMLSFRKKQPGTGDRSGRYYEGIGLRPEAESAPAGLHFKGTGYASDARPAPNAAEPSDEIPF